VSWRTPFVLAIVILVQEPSIQDVRKAVEGLKSDDVKIREEAARKLRDYGSSAESELKKLASEGDLDSAGRARALLAELTPEGQFRRIIETAESAVSLTISVKSDSTFKDAPVVKRLQTEMSLATTEGQAKLTYEIKGIGQPIKRTEKLEDGLIRALVTIGSTPTLELAFDFRKEGMRQERFLSFVKSLKVSEFAVAPRDSFGESITYKAAYTHPTDESREVVNSTRLWLDRKGCRITRREVKYEEVHTIETYSEWKTK